MKTLLLSILISLSVFSQSKDTLITYSEIVNVDSLNKDQLFINARDWFNVTFNSSKDVLQIVDKDNGQLSGKGILSGTYKFRYLGVHESQIRCSFNIEIRVKEGKYKYIFSNFEETEQFNTLLTSSDVAPKRVLGGFSQSKSDEIWVSIRNGVNVSVKGLILILKEKMKTKSNDGF